MMDIITLTARLRQLLAVDQNAWAIYLKLAKLAPEEGLRETFSKIAQDEQRHMLLDKEILLLLEG